MLTEILLNGFYRLLILNDFQYVDDAGLAKFTLVRLLGTYRFAPSTLPRLASAAGLTAIRWAQTGKAYP
jgi:hypothetical protein